jgi:hypothetical protein
MRNERHSPKKEEKQAVHFDKVIAKDTQTSYCCHNLLGQQTSVGRLEAMSPLNHSVGWASKADTSGEWR